MVGIACVVAAWLWACWPLSSEVTTVASRPSSQVVAPSVPEQNVTWNLPGWVAVVPNRPAAPAVRAWVLVSVIAQAGGMIAVLDGAEGPGLMYLQVDQMVGDERVTAISPSQVTLRGPLGERMIGKANP